VCVTGHLKGCDVCRLEEEACGVCVTGHSAWERDRHPKNDVCEVRDV